MGVTTWDLPASSVKSIPSLLSVFASATLQRSSYKDVFSGTSLLVQWLGLWASTAGGPDSTPGQGTKIAQAMQYGKKKQDRLFYAKAWITCRIKSGSVMPDSWVIVGSYGHLEKAEEPEIKLPISTGSLKKQESSRKTSIFALLTMPKPSTLWITINCRKFWKRWEYQTTWPACWETCMPVRKQQLELDMEQQTGSK